MSEVVTKARSFGIGWVFALVGLILAIVFWAVGTDLTATKIEGLLVLAFLAILL